MFVCHLLYLQGEGAIPTDKGGVQSLISLQFGGRLRTMTCSDKILKWNVLGLQGALLSHFMDPVYLTSLSIGRRSYVESWRLSSLFVEFQL